MTDIKKRGKLPFTIVSSSVNTGYAASLTASVGANIDIVNMHRDEYAEFEGTPAQGPFTQQHVGGNQHRHAGINTGTDNSNNRAEAYIITPSTNTVRIYGPDINGSSKPRATLTRGLVSKSVVNIANIPTAGIVAGNYEKNYQIVQAVGRRDFNNLINDGFIASGSLTTKFIAGIAPYSLPDISSNSKSIFVGRFNAPGGARESSRGALDREGEELAPNNSLTTRNLVVRQPFYAQLTQHAAQFNSGSVEGTTIHAINRNGFKRLEYSGSSVVTASNHDNFWVQHSIPATDLGYAWITGSLTSSQSLIQYQNFGGSYTRDGAFSDIEFEQTGPFGDHIGISGVANRELASLSTKNNTLSYDKTRYLFTGTDDLYIKLNPIVKEIEHRDFTVSMWFSVPSIQNLADIFSYGDSLTGNILYLSSSNNLRDSFAIDGNSNTPEVLYSIDASVSDAQWHMVTLVNDVSTTIKTVRNSVATGVRTVAESSTITNVYVDGGLVLKTRQKHVNLDLTRFFVSIGRLGQSAGSMMDQIYVWNSALSEAQINDVHRKTKSGNENEAPKKFDQHLLSDISVPAPIHVYGTKFNTANTEVIDEVGSVNAQLNDFTPGINLSPTTTGLISYRRYDGSSWKSTRNADSVVTRGFNRGPDSNTVSILIPEGDKVITSVVNGVTVRRTVPGGKKQGTLKNFKEPPVYMNKPLKHRFILKDSVDPSTAFEITHTYDNNVKYFANEEINRILGLKKIEDQVYDRLYNFYGNENVEENENPIQKNLGYTFSQVVFPKPEEAFLDSVRSRPNYITTQDGFGIDGYDRQLGTQRAFWRDSIADRQRTSSSSLNSLGIQPHDNSSISQQLSMASLEYITDAHEIKSQIYRDIDPYVSGTGFQLMFEYSTQNTTNGAELNGVEFLFKKRSDIYISAGAISFAEFKFVAYPPSMAPELFFSSTDFSVLGCIPSASIYPTPKYVYQHAFEVASLTSGPQLLSQVFLSSSIDLGMNRLTSIISGKNPWYDSYEAFSEDVLPVAKDHGSIPEFNISKKFSEDNLGMTGNFRKVIVGDVIDNVSINNVIHSENDKFVKQKSITINISAAKKLLPYNGFYPQDRSLQLFNLLHSSYLKNGGIKGGTFTTSSAGESIIYDDIDGGYGLERYHKESAFIEPLYSPGIFYNLIKSGIAVDWSIYTGSLPFPPTDISGVDSLYLSLGAAPSYRIPFEAILSPSNYMPISSSNKTSENRIIKTKEIEELKGSGSYQGFCEITSKNNPDYQLAINNFLASTVEFFLKQSKLTSHVSLSDSKFKSFKSSKTYYMDVVIKKSEDFKMVDAYSASLLANMGTTASPDMQNNIYFGNMTGRYFGPSYFTGSSATAAEISSSYKFSQTLLDPAYCIYTPPYFYGETVARISFKPPTSRKYTLEEIFAAANIEHISTGLRNVTKYPSGSLFESVAMPVESSVSIFGQIDEPNIQFDINSGISPALKNSNNLAKSTGRPATLDNNSGNKKWVISTKMETPILNFANQEYMSNSVFLKTSSYEAEVAFIRDASNITEPTLLSQHTGSGHGIGMWSGYGEFPEGNEGVFLEIRESFPDKNNRFNATSTTGSLIDMCGFKPESSKVGEIADEKVISEAVMIVPYSVKSRGTKTVSGISVGGTISIEGRHLYKINRDIFRKQKTNLENGRPAVVAGDFGADAERQKTSISQMIETMNKYVIPPNMNFLEYSDISPFAMYIVEFESKLDKQDLADIWQGVMPKPAMNVELENVEISHENTIHDFFHGEGMPEDTKFMIVKLKRKAEVNYYKTTADSTDDDRFRFDFEVGKKAPEYSFNWPYDYFSLVELAKVDINIDYEAREDEAKVIKTALDPSKLAINNIVTSNEVKAGITGPAVRGSSKKRGFKR